MKSTCMRWWLLAAFVSAAGCGGGGDGTDAGSDADVADLETTNDDGGGREDGREDGTDAETEGTPTDADGDTYPEGEDCDDGDAEVHPGAIETCNGIDDNCDGTTDEDSAVDAATWYADADGDSFGDAETTRTACDMPAGYVANDEDCDDGDDSINPDTDEVCNGADDDCDGETDENGAVGSTAYYPDTDVDGFGDEAAMVLACALPTGYTSFGGDCDDTNDAVNPDADELCNGADDNCDGVTDEDTAGDAVTFFRDADGDGFGNAADTTVACAAPAGYVADDTDCDDGDASINPAAPDLPDLFGIDLNCDTVDGDLTLAVFASSTDGNDASTGLGTLNPDGSLTVVPVQTLARAVEIADACDPKCYVLIAAGTYNQGTATLALRSGVSLYGGYDETWVRNRPIGDTVLTSTASPTVQADALTSATTVELLTLRGPDVATAGGESVALLVTGTADASLLVFRGIEVNAGRGGAGSAGIHGTLRSSCSAPGGAAGTSFSCGSTAGGAGGGCTVGTAGTSWCKSSCVYWTGGTPTDGTAGGNGTLGSNGAAGGGASGNTVGYFTGSDWRPDAGGGGGGVAGGDGGGGCGGGGGGWWQNFCAGPFDFCEWQIPGGNGGAGGTGACGADGGGGGGQGGGSFGIVLLDSTLTIDTVGLRLGTGGTGGAGGSGGNGASGWAGGAGAPGDFMATCGWIIGPQSGSGGDGGNGGNGGGGAGGAGGNGGPSIGLVLLGTSTTPLGIPSYDITGGAGGAGGDSGAGGLQGGGGLAAPSGAAGRLGTFLNTRRF
ncbi:MAG: putative metal-binding motif-containing protein [Deltaproteobacteria bacterium]|nr:putative metal-binding motif-containing protein [Deltaproteobacteria bacterium]